MSADHSTFWIIFWGALLQIALIGFGGLWGLYRLIHMTSCVP